MEIDIRAVQLRELEILKAVMDVCDRHGLRWWADGGTCIGAIRHGGFIPWDDDVDIGMPRADFDRFRQIAPRELPPDLAVQDFQTNRQAAHFILKVHDVTTTFVEEDLAPYPQAHTGVYIDIFPFDGCPDPGPERDKMFRRVKRLRLVNGFLRATWADTRTLGQKLRYVLLYPVRWVLPFNWATKKMEDLARRYPLDRYPCASECFGWVIYPTASIRQTAPHPFEDTALPCPEDYDAYLRGYYGDYMQPPPPEERFPSHPVAWFSLEKSYRDRWWEVDK